jgi:hypothetical protein
VTLPEAPTGLPRFRHVPFMREMASDPGRAAAPRITAPFMLPSPQRTGSASATSVITWLNPIPHMIAVYASAPPLPVGPATLATGRLATPYLGGTSTRWTAPASPGAPDSTGPPVTRCPPMGWSDWQGDRVVRSRVGLAASTLAAQPRWMVLRSSAYGLKSRPSGRREPNPPERLAYGFLGFQYSIQSVG